MSDLAISLALVGLAVLGAALYAGWRLIASMRRARAAEPGPKYTVGIDVAYYDRLIYYSVIDATNPDQLHMVAHEVQEFDTVGDVSRWVIDLLEQYQPATIMTEDNGFGALIVETLKSTLDGRPATVKGFTITASNKARLVQRYKEALESGLLTIDPEAARRGFRTGKHLEQPLADAFAWQAAEEEL